MSFHAESSIPGQHLFELKFQRVHRAVQHRAESVRPLRQQQIARVQAGRQRGDGEVHVLTDEDGQPPIHAGVAAGVGVEDQYHTGSETAELTDVAIVESGAHCGDDRQHAHLMSHENVRVAFHHRQITGRRRGVPRLVDAVEILTLDEERRVA